MKPDWSKMEDDSMAWLCQDSDGMWWFTTHKPRASQSVWVGDVDSFWTYAGRDGDIS